MPICCRQYRGFTLLEVLIAMSIFAIIGLASYRVLNVVILSQSQVSVHDEKIRTLERAMHIISADFEQLANRPVRDNYADTLAALIAPHDNYAIEFTRQGWRNPLQLPRSQLQRVAYELGSIANDSDEAGTHLLRHYWTVLDRAQDSEPRTQERYRRSAHSFYGSAGAVAKRMARQIGSGRIQQRFTRRAISGIKQPKNRQHPAHVPTH